MISKLIYQILKPIFIKHYFLEQSKRTGFEQMRHCFIDSNGKAYYTTDSDLSLPIQRSKELQVRIMRLKAGMSDDNIKLFCEAMKKALNKGKNPDVAMVGHLIVEIERRVDAWTDVDLLFDTVAFMYVREDEDPCVVDMEIHLEKIEQFKKDSTGGLRDFFYTAGLIEFIPFLGISETEWSEYFLKSQIKMKAIQAQMQHYITDQKLQ
jgi:hypothetical protein